MFNQLEKCQKVSLEMIVKEKKFAKSDIIWRRGDLPSAVYIVKEGECAYEMSENAGKIMRTGEFIGETLCIFNK